MAQEQRFLAPAKVNLYLHVLGRRASDGYHELDSLIAFAGVGDEVTASPAPAGEVSLVIEGPFAGILQGDQAENLVLKAARLLALKAGIEGRAGVRLRLVKNLPVASGIGGGSSDAAAALRALAALWRLDIDAAALARLGAGLGADVPVCLFNRPAWVGGIGEKIEAAPPMPAAALVLVNPGIGLSTPSVFKARGGGWSKPARWTETPPDAAALAALLAERHNDLTDAALGLVPAIADILAWLNRQEGVLLARMSGSGATCFALCADLDAARLTVSRTREAHPGWWADAGTLT